MSSQTLVRLAQDGSLDAVKAFVESNRDSPKEIDPETGRLPFHDLVLGWQNSDSGEWQTIPVGIAAYLIRMNPKSLVDSDDEGNTPLHSIMKIRRDDFPLDLFQLIFDGAQFVCGFRNEKGLLPIDLALVGEKECGGGGGGGCSTLCARHLIQNDYCEFSTRHQQGDDLFSPGGVTATNDGAAPRLATVPTPLPALMLS